MTGAYRRPDRLCQAIQHRAMVAVLAACAGLFGTAWRVSAGEQDAIVSVPLAERAAPVGETMFRSVPAQRTGVDFVHRWAPGASYEYQRQVQNAFGGGGVCVGDFDGDDRPDIYLTSPQGGNRLYRNLGDFRFHDVTDKAGLGAAHGGQAWGSGASFADVDNDSDLDLYVCGYDTPNRLYVNQGDGTFQESAAAAGLAFHGASVMMAFADYDNDGDLDGYLLTNRLTPPENTKAQRSETRGRLVVAEHQREAFDVIVRDHDRKGIVISAGQFDHLFRNDGDGTFTDVTYESGITGNHYGLSATWWDFNRDGYPDIYVANDFWGPDQLYQNNHDGTFTNVIDTAVGHTPWFSMGSDTADVNNDGLPDLMGSDMAGTSHFRQKVAMGDMYQWGWFLEQGTPRQYMRNVLYVNTGTGRFLEAAYLAGLDASNWTWSVKFGDLNNDGLVDVFISNGMTRDWFHCDIRDEVQQHIVNQGGLYLDALRYWMNTPMLREPNMALVNRGDLRFEPVGPQWGLDYHGVSFGAALADLDRDGDLDLIVNNFTEPPGIYRNQENSARRALIRLVGTVSNRDGIGAVVRVTTPDGTQMRYNTPCRGFMSANELRVHFGLGPHQRIDKLRVEWPSGHVQTFDDLPADRSYTITEPAAAAPGRDPSVRNAWTAADEQLWFTRSNALNRVWHRERPYDDFARQPLLPHKLSQLGPGIAWGDADGDGDDDLWIGGAAGRAAQIVSREEDGRFVRSTQRVFLNDRDHEDMGAVWFDADVDGDLDLYVVSGGVECDADSDLLRDRLYLNDGGGRFGSAPPRALPDVTDSGSVVCAADFDGDGDLDLFIGGRVVPGQYPLASDNRLLRNDWPDLQRFSDVTDEVAPGLRESGMVTGAVWSDTDGDGTVDLLVTHEWGPVTLYQNDQDSDRLADRTAQAGLADRRGWFNGIAAGDVDQDGDMDYVVTNFGLNTKYRASAKHPTLLYYGDLDGAGAIRIVEAEFEGDVCYPVRGRSCSTSAMPSLRGRFPTFENFALATLQDLYSVDRLNQVTRLEANTLESGILVNDGQGIFTFTPLPRLAQISPAFGVVVFDADGDSHLDIVLAQNFFSPQRETGRMDGGVGLLLRGRGDTTFEPVWPNRSGVVVPGDAMGLTTTDLNADGRPDLVVAINNHRMMAFENTSVSPHHRLNVRLRGKSGNTTAAGARITARLDDGAELVRELYAGSGYLSQSSSTVSFGLERSSRIEHVTVFWPDGTSSETPVDTSTTGIMVIDQP